MATSVAAARMVRWSSLAVERGVPHSEQRGWSFQSYLHLGQRRVVASSVAGSLMAMPKR